MITRTDLLDKLQNGAVWNTGVTFERTNPVPIEKYSIFATLTEAQTYAFENPVAYPGQTLAVVTDTNEVTLYIVQSGATSAETSLIEVGSATLGDGVSVELDEINKVIKLKDFGKFYYKEVVTTTKDGEGNDVTTVTHEKVTGFKSGLQPRVRLTDDSKLELAWYEPSSITVEGLSAQISSLSETVRTLEDTATRADTTAGQNALDIEALEGTTTSHGERLDQAEADINTIKSTHYTKEDVNKLIGDAAHFQTKIVSTTADVTEPAILYLIKDPVADAAGRNDVYFEYIFVEGEGAVCIGDTTTDLSNYYNKTQVDSLLGDKADAADLTTNVNTLSGRIDAVDGKFKDYATTAKLAEELAKYDTAEEVSAKVKVATDAAAKNAQDLSALSSTVEGQGATITTHTQGLVDVNARVDTVNDEITGIKTSITNLGDTYATDVELAAVKKDLEDAHSESVDAINAAIAEKADKSEVYTKNEVDTKFGDYNTKTEVDNKIAAIYAGSDSLADYISDNRDTLPGLLSASDAAALGALNARLAELKINTTSEIKATANATGGVDLSIEKVAVSKLESDVTLYLNCGDAATV